MSCENHKCCHGKRRRHSIHRIVVPVNDLFLLAPAAVSRVGLRIYISGSWSGSVAFSPYPITTADGGFKMIAVSGWYHPIILDEGGLGDTITSAWYGFGDGISGSSPALSVIETLAE